MKHIITVANPHGNDIAPNSGCGECRSSCQSACKTSCTVGNQVCEQKTAVNHKNDKRSALSQKNK